MQNACQELLDSKHITIRDVAHVIGLLVSSFLYYRRLELSKINALRANQGNYDASMCLSEGSQTELLWWTQNITQSCRSLITTKPDLILTTDASLLGWGAVSNEKETEGHWHLEEKSLHINVLEMKAVMLGQQALCKDANNVHICLKSDNTTATVSYINSMGGVKSEICITMALQIWEWCIARQIWISARHIPGSQNVQADKASREFKDSVEWTLSGEIFQDINNHWGPSDIDMFASRLNYKVDAYASWRPDPGAKFTDAFCFNWESYFFYAFPPFSLICQCLKKIEDNSSGVMIVLYWTTQAWCSIVLTLLIDYPLVLPQSDNLLQLPQSGKQHPLRWKMRLLACKVSGRVSVRETFQAKLQQLCNPGLTPPSSNTNLTSRPGLSCVLNGKLIPIIHL